MFIAIDWGAFGPCVLFTNKGRNVQLLLLFNQLDPV